MSGSTRTRRWREKRAAEGKKSFTILLSAEAQQIINSEIEKTGNTYSEILERALEALRSPERIEPPNQKKELLSQSAAEDMNSQLPAIPPSNTIKHTRILIDDLQNYEFKEDRIDFSYKKAPADYLNRNPRENIIKRLVRIPKKKWFR